MSTPATRLALGGLLALTLGGCATSQPQHTPDLHDQARALASRQLDDPGLMAAEQRFGLSTATPVTWTPDRITVAAWYFDPRLAQARAVSARATAAATLAAQRVNPTLQLNLEKIFSGVGTGSPWTTGIAMLLPLLHPAEATARRHIAAADTEGARDQAALAVWQTRARALAALRNTLLSRQAQALAETTVRDRRAYLEGVRQRVQAGAEARDTELAAELQLQRAEAGLADRRARRHAAEQSLAAAIGLRWPALADARLEWPDLQAPPAPSTLPTSALAEDAAWNRLDLAMLLAHYRASAARLRMAVGTRFPAMAVAPGYIYDRGARKFSFGMDVELPLFHGAGARIEEAAAARDEAAAAIRTRQMEILNALDAARADYAGRYAAWRQMSAAAATARMAARRAAVQRSAGQLDYGAELSAEVIASTTALAAEDALSSTLHSLGDLEDVLQHPLWPTTRLPDIQRSSSSASAHHEASHEQHP
ncbi:MAG: TolC family protein [Rhodanobacter sp.]|jgi:outer membrane protein TolC